MWRVSHKYHQSKRFTGIHYMMVATWAQIIYTVANNYKEGEFSALNYILLWLLCKHYVMLLRKLYLMIRD